MGDTNQHIKEMLKEEQVAMVVDDDDSDMGEADDWSDMSKYLHYTISIHILTFKIIDHSLEGFLLEYPEVFVTFISFYFLTLFRLI